MSEEVSVLIVGAGPAGLATAACLNLHSIPHTILEREDCFASLWKKHCYDRLHLNLAKSFSELPHLPLPSSYPKFLSKDHFISYLDTYVSHFSISPTYHRRVELACYDESYEKWIVRAKNLKSGEVEEYKGRFLVVAIGEQTDPYVPELDGLRSFPGDVLHSNRYTNGKAYQGKRVLVVGCGSSGMDIALDLAEFDAKTSIIVHRPIHILPREVGSWGINFIWELKFPVGMVDWIMVVLSNLCYGDMTKYGIFRPKEGPFALAVKGKRPVFDVGTCDKIKTGKIQVLRTRIARIRGDEVSFEDGRSHNFDAMVLCTGFKRPVKLWLKGDDTLFNDDGTAKLRFPNHWKGKNGLYAQGLSNKGLTGINKDAQNIADDIKSLLSC